jgi:hypothetical protein
MAEGRIESDRDSEDVRLSTHANRPRPAVHSAILWSSVVLWLIRCRPSREA